MEINDILLQIKSTPGTLDKKAILELHKDNEVLKTVLKMTLDPSIVSGYKKIPAAQETDNKLSLKDALSLLSENIYTRIATGNAGRDFISKILGSVSESDAEVLTKVLTKNLDCGVQEKNVNDVFGKNFIKDEPYMRCSLVDVKTIKNIDFKKYGYAVSERKMDGQYLNSSVVNGILTCTSRNGKVYDFLGKRDEVMAELAKEIQKRDTRFDSGVVFNGECLVLDFDGTILPRETGNGIIQKAGKDTMTVLEADSVLFVLWDVLPQDAFQEGRWDVSRKERREMLEGAIKAVNSEFVQMVDYRIVHNIDEAFDYNNEQMELGEEGSVLKCESAVWKAHTSPKQLKMKLKMDIDLKIIGFNEGEGKRKGMLGSLQLASADGVLTVNCGTGIKEKGADYTFQSIWDNRDELLNKVVTITCNNLTTDKRTGKQKVFLPVFGEIRFDKDTADTFERILEIKESAIFVFKEALSSINR